MRRRENPGAVFLFRLCERSPSFFLPGGVFFGNIEFGCIGIVIDEPVEFERYDPFHEVFGRQPREAFQGDGQVRGDFFLVDFDFFYAVYEVIELFFADLFSGRYGAFFELFCR